MLTINNLTIKFRDSNGAPAVNNFSLNINEGERLGLVGESGSGKTITALAVAGLIERRRTAVSGEIIFMGQDLLKMNRPELRKIQGRDIGFVFQEPTSSLNPTMKIGRQIEETLRIHTDLSRNERKTKALAAMRSCELLDAETIYKKYPHQLSGGQRQRAMIAAAIIAGPKLLIADEPTTALDVSVQAQIIALLRRISVESRVSILFISHNLAVVRGLCDRVIVMEGGRIVETGDTEKIFISPKEVYTKRLIDAIPRRKPNG